MKVLNDLVASGFASNSSAFAGGGGSVSMSQVTVDFGTTPVSSALFTVALVGVTVGQKVMALATASGSLDELEMDGLVVAGRVPANDTLELAITALQGPVVGSKLINVLLG